MKKKRPNEQAKAGRCNHRGPNEFAYQHCGRWKGHSGPHRNMCPRREVPDDEWPNAAESEADLLSASPVDSQEKP